MRLAVATPAEVEEFRRLQAIEYASQKVRAGMWAPAEALPHAEREIRALLAPGFEQRGHAVLVARSESGERAGWVWIGPDPDGSLATYLYQITVEAPLRGRGVGRAMLAETERVVAQAGGKEIRLNVFRFNAPALALYRGAGYSVVDEDAHALRLSKSLA